MRGWYKGITIMDCHYLLNILLSSQNAKQGVERATASNILIIQGHLYECAQTHKGETHRHTISQY